MQAIMYDPGHAELIAEVGNFMHHLTECDRCRAKSTTDPMWIGGIANMIDALNSAMATEIAPGDCQTALEMCHTWMRVHESMSMCDLLIVTPKEPDSDGPAKH